MTPADLDTAEFRAILGVLSDLVVHIDAERKIRFVSRVEVGYPPELAVGKHVDEFVAPESRAEHTVLLDRVFESMEAAAQVTEITGADGKREWYEGTMIPIVRDGRVASVVIVTRNVTARRLAEQELTALRSLLPVCAWCRQIRTDEGEWQPLETYLEGSGKMRVTHGICPDCEQTIFGENDLESA